MKKKLMIFTIGASSLFAGCGAEPQQGAESNLAAVASSVTSTKTYEGSENGAVCSLAITTDAKNEVVGMYYSSEGCESDPITKSKCSVDFTKGLKGLFPSFDRAPSVRFPGFTRLAYLHGVSPTIYPTIGLLAWDDFIVAKDNLSTVKAASRSLFTAAKSYSWTSECSDMKQVR